MDKAGAFIENVSGYSMWDIRNAIDKVTAKVMNLTEMEQKVREATSNDPWGASGTLKQELAQATHDFQYFNEIMPAIFKRFTDNENREWRQIYKALILLEYLVTHGSERAVDEARGHISTIKHLRSFQYVDDNGKDEGINVRNRAKEFAEMLSSVDRIKEERKKAKANRNKYTGVSSEGGGGRGGFAGTGNKYGGFGSDSYFDGGSSGGGYGDNDSYGRGGGSSRSSSRYEEDFRDPSTSPPARRTARRADSTKATEPKPKPQPQPVKEVNLFDFGDDEPVAAPVAQPAKASSAGVDEWGTFQSGGDDFDDFQVAPPVSSTSSGKQTAIPGFPAYTPSMASVLPPIKPVSQNKPASSSNVMDLLGDDFGSVSMTSSNSGFNSKPASSNNSSMDFFGSSSSTSNVSTPASLNSSRPLQPMNSTPAFGMAGASSQNSSKPSTPGSNNPNDIWANASGLISLDGLGKTKAKESSAPSMNSMAANSWNSGAWASKPATPAGQAKSNPLNDIKW